MGVFLTLVWFLAGATADGGLNADWMVWRPGEYPFDGPQWA
jgi:hypothetical protein